DPGRDARGTHRGDARDTHRGDTHRGDAHGGSGGGVQPPGSRGADRRGRDVLAVTKINVPREALLPPGQRKEVPDMMTPKEVAAVAAKALDDRKGVDIRLLEITDVTT